MAIRSDKTIQGVRPNGGPETYRKVTKNMISQKYENKFRTASRKALSTGLGVLLAVGMAGAPAIQAMAEESGTTSTASQRAGDVTINNTQSESEKGNADVTYKAIKIFDATVQANKSNSAHDGSTASLTTENDPDAAQSNLTGDITSGEVKDVQWASSDMETRVKGVLEKGAWGGETFGAFVKAAHPGSTADSTAQDAAEYIKAHITDPIGTKSGNTASSTYILDNAELGNQLADALKDVPAATDADGASLGQMKPGQTMRFNGGYYLIVTNTDSVSRKENSHGTAPIFLAAGGAPVTITQKADRYPTVKKEVADDAAPDEYGEVAASQIGQDIHYRLTATLPSNLKTYKTYKMVFHDTLPKGLTADSDSFDVYVKNGNTKTEVDKAGWTLENPAAPEGGYTAEHPAVVTIGDAKALKDANGTAITVDENSEIVVEYTAEINDKAVQGGDGNTNTLRLEYSNNPNTDSTGTTEEQKTTDYTYTLNLHKQDKNTNQSLQGAKFTIQATGADDQGSTDKYVQKDGTLAATAFEFETDGDGNIAVSGLDEGTYTLHETHAPEGYNQVPDATFTINAEYNGQTISEFSNTVAGGNDAFAGQLVYAGLGSTEQDAAKAGGDKAAATANTGIVRVTAEDVKTVDMPFTGQQGITLLTIIGTGIVGISVAEYLRRRKKSQDAAVDGNGPAAA